MSLATPRDSGAPNFKPGAVAPGPGPLAEGLSAAALAAVMSHPEFPTAMRASAAGAVAHYNAFTRMRRYSRDRGSYLISLAAIYLHFSEEVLTATRLKSLCARQGIASEGRVAAVLAYMRGRGDLLGLLNPEDRRVRELVPGEAFTAFQRARVRVEIVALADLHPAGDALIAAFDRGDLFERYMRISAPLLLANFATATDEHTLLLNYFADRDVGLLMLYELIGNPSAMRAEPFKIWISAVAARLGVSRVHILALLLDTETAGYLDWRRDSREVVFYPSLIAALNYYYGVLFMFTGYHAALALAAQGARKAAA
jgi:hypothetical protein